MRTAKVFEIQRCCIHDGPGIRTVVFLKGCPLECAWCCNPESQKMYDEIGFYARKCIGCGSCAASCAKENISLTGKTHVKDRDQCIFCEEKTCVSRCPSLAIRRYGEEWSVEEVMAEVEKDRGFYGESGGVTLSGGVALLQADFAAALFADCHTKGINTALETCGYVPWEQFEKVLPHTDYVMMDIKHVDAKRFREGTRGEAALPADNLSHLLRTKKRVEVRLPLIPGFNSDETSLRQIYTFLKKCNVQKLTVLPFHKLAKEKYKSLGREYAFGETALLSGEELRQAEQIAEEYGIACVFHS